jgi:hypothetical protein
VQLGLTLITERPPIVQRFSFPCSSPIRIARARQRASGSDQGPIEAARSPRLFRIDWPRKSPGANGDGQPELLGKWIVSDHGTNSLEKGRFETLLKTLQLFPSSQNDLLWEPLPLFPVFKLKRDGLCGSRYANWSIFYFCRNCSNVTFVCRGLVCAAPGRRTGPF